MSDWATAGLQVNPPQGFVLATTGPLDVGTKRFAVLYTTTVLAGLTIEHRKQDNALLHNQNLLLTANSAGAIHAGGVGIDITTPGEYIQVVTNGVYIGFIQASILRD